ncbi:MAG: hypothetical protein MK041_05405, partial [Aquabacterium sp.]|nr:hypothetical protein [Aquabacterium sp.]
MAAILAPNRAAARPSAVPPAPVASSAAAGSAARTTRAAPAASSVMSVSVRVVTPNNRWRKASFSAASASASAA